MSKNNESKRSRRRFLGEMGIAGATTAGIASSMGFSRQAAAASGERAARRPNIILLLTDDQRWDAMGCMGNKIIQTPNMDRLARDGVLFVNNFCTTSICMSSRASILTGMYARRHQINSFALPLSSIAFPYVYPAVLRKAGYRTGFVGKWGLGGPLPTEKFDFFRGFSGQGHYFQKVQGKEVHLTRLMARDAEQFLDGCAKDQPFCLSISTKSPHVQDGHPDPFRYDPALADLYKDVEIPVPKKADPKYFEALPDFLKQSEGRVRWKRRFSTPELYQHSVKGYYRLITGVDIALGKIMSKLKQLRFDDDTVIIYTSDNGFFLGEYGLAGKWLMYEESIRTPLIVYDPRLPKIARGQRRTEMTLNIDLAPTLLDLAGVEIPALMQGRNLRPLLEAKHVAWRDDWFYEHLFVHPRIPRNEGVRTKRWKYIRYLDARPAREELYDLENDPAELNNVAGQQKNKKVLQALRKRWREFRVSLI